MKVYTVAEVINEARWMLEDAFGSISVSGEVSQPVRSRPGHLYFTLKDADAALSSVMWASSAKRLTFEVEEGLSFIATGKLTIYPPQGRFQFAVTRLVPEGVGALQLAFEQLKKRLMAEGLFDKERKQDIPKLPLRVGVITSASGAALQDFIRMIRRAPVPVDLSLYPSLVQGSRAAEEIVKGIDLFSRHACVDVVVLTRGGGSLEDLQPFNDERVARAIAACRVPLLSAVGHEVDVTISDMVADLRLATPTAAGEFIASRVETEVQRISDLGRRLAESMEGSIGERAERLKQARRLLNINRLREMVHFRGESLHSLLKRLASLREQIILSRARVHREHALYLKDLTRKVVMKSAGELPSRRLFRSLMGRFMENRSEEIISRRRQLELLSPRRVLARGYSISRRKDGSVVKCSRDVTLEETLEIILHEGKIKCRVKEKK